MKSDFKTQMITGLLSSPVIYVPSSHYRYIDEVLSEILGSQNRILQASLDDVYEFDLSRDMVVHFKSKKKDSNVQGVGNAISFLSEHLETGKADIQISIIKDCSALCEKMGQQHPDQSVSTILSYIAQKYEAGEMNPLSTVILCSPTPVEGLQQSIVDVVTVIDLPIPAFSEIESIVKEIPISRQAEYEEDRVRLEFSRNLQGLRLADIRQILRSCLVRSNGRLSRQTLTLALEEKKQIVKKTGVIEVVDANERLEDVGGLENLIEEIKRKKVIFENLSLAMSKDASVALPKGVLIIGMPGCGKSMIAKSIASEFNVALLRLDVNRLMGKYVGESETNLRRALETAEAAHPCVLWIDEIEKAFAGVDSGHNDIIVRLMGHFLTWMQERKSAIYVVATANDTLKPELMRKGRFDEVFFVDFPNKKESQSILEKIINKYKVDTKYYDWSEITPNIIKNIADHICNGSAFSGAELNAMVAEVVENAFRNYVVQLDKQNAPNAKITPIKITENAFIGVIDSMKNFVMSKQLSKDTDSAIRRISSLKKIFDIKPASKD